MYKSTHIALVLVTTLALAACQQEAPPPIEPTPQAATTPTSAPADRITPITSPLLSITPDNMAACNPAIVAKLQWDVRNAHPEAPTVSIYAGTGADAKLFATEGARGEAQTGPWVHPGTRFQLRNSATGEIFADITVGGPKCS